MALYHPDKDGIFPPDGEVVFAWTKEMRPPCRAICAAHDEYGWYNRNGYSIKEEIGTWANRDAEYWLPHETHYERKDKVPIMSWTDSNGAKHELLLSK